MTEDKYCQTTEEMADTVLQVVDLKQYFPIKDGLLQRVVGHVKAVDGVSFKINRGKTMGLVGESGCGKTTVGKTILRLNEKTSGEVLFFGFDIYALTKKEMRKIRPKMQIIFQDPYSSLVAAFTGRRDHWRSCQGAPDRAR